VDYTTTALLASVRRRAMLPTATAAGTEDADLLRVLNEELQSYVVPVLLSLREDFLLYDEDVATVAGTAAYRIPSRAIGGKLREAAIVTSSGAVRNLSRIQIDELEEWGSGTGTPTAFYFKGGKLVLMPTPSTAETLRLTYYIRPNELVAATATRVVSSVNTGTGVVTLSSAAPGTFTTGVRYDIIAGASGFEPMAINLPASAVSGSDVTFDAADLPSGLAAGDYVCLAEQSPVAQVPAEWHPLLVQRVAAHFLEMTGFLQEAQAAGMEAGRLEEKLRTTFAPRIDGEPKIVGANGYGLMGDIQWTGGGW
jgi:hypothetical protein